MKIFIIGKTTMDMEIGGVWECQGAFATEEEAVTACHSGEWIGPLELGVRLPDEAHDWPGAYYPHAA